jgi:hypothetical protein
VANYGIVLRCPNIVADDRLIYFDYNRDRGTWVMRDFIGGHRLDNLHSTLTVQQIEADATYDEYPAWCNAETHPQDWCTYLKLRTTAVFRLGRTLGETTTPNQNSGHWQRP